MICLCSPRNSRIDSLSQTAHNNCMRTCEARLTQLVDAFIVDVLRRVRACFFL